MLLFPRVYMGAALVSVLAAVGLFSAGHAEADLIVNGDFHGGNTGFSSDYIYTPPPTPENMVEGRYTVSTDPTDVHSKWDSIGDHTTGTGMMLIANGATNSTTVVWREDVTLTAGVTYDLSAWATSVYSTLPANLIFEIDGTSLGTLQLTDTVPDWQQFKAGFTASTNGPAQLAIRDLVTIQVGNDFALDDISLTIIPEPTTSLLLWSLLGVLVLFRWRRYSPNRGLQG